MTDIVPTTRKRLRPGAPRWGSYAGPDLTVAKRESIWTATAKMPTRRRLERDLATDVCVVGAGIAGLSVAYTLAKAGRRVVVLDDGPLAGGMTAVTTAHITSAIDNRYFEVERLHGEENTRLVAHSMVAAIERIAQIVEEEGIDCDFARLDGYLFVPPGEPADVLERELQACHRAGLTDVELLLRAPLKSFDSGPALRFKNQAQFHPLKYLTALTRALERAGGQVFCKTHVDAVSGGIPAEIKAGKRTVRADAVVVATNSPINDMVAIHTKQAPYMTYVIGAMVPFGSVPRALYWDTADPYHYVRLQDYDDTHDVLIVGGEDHKTGQDDDPEERQVRLEQWARSRFPTMHEIKFRWGGQVMEPVDALAFIGHNPMDKENVYIATGDSGQGISNGTIAGMLIPDLILGRPNPWAEIYDPSRKTAKAIGEFARENLNVALQYTDHLTPGEVKTADEIPPDSGAVMRRGISKIAVYRDETGTVHEFSATCPHLGCVVAWNDAEKSWDCPCHGSRFEKTGKLMNGPANTDLKPILSGKGARSRQRT